MLADKPSLWPPTLLGFAIVICLSLWQQIPPHIPHWLALMAYFFAFPLFLVWVLSWVGYLLQAVGYFRAMWNIGRPDVRILESLSRMSNDQLEYLGWLWGTVGEGEPGTSDNLIPLHTGEHIPASVMTRIAAGADGNELIPEHLLHVDQKNTRDGYGVLGRAGVIAKGHGNRPPTVKDALLFQQLVDIAKKKR